MVANNFPFYKPNLRGQPRLSLVLRPFRTPANFCALTCLLTGGCFSSSHRRLLWGTMFVFAILLNNTQLYYIHPGIYYASSDRQESTAPALALAAVVQLDRSNLTDLRSPHFRGGRQQRQTLWRDCEEIMLRMCNLKHRLKYTVKYINYLTG